MRVGVRRRLAASCAIVLAALGVVTAPSDPAAAAPTVPFTAKFSTNANGAITTIGNNLLTCRTSDSGCTNAQNGGSADKNGFVMVNLHADGVAGPTNSSSSRLALPEGSTVLWAGLYWGARLQAGTGGRGASSAGINTMSLRAPGDAGYRPVSASTAADDQFGPNSQSFNAYQRFADVTDIVREAGNGDYWGANVTAATGQDRYAGWAMTVVYSAPGLPLRNLTVFDGFNVVERGAPQTVRVSGFLAPQSGPVDAQLTMLTYEGDLAQTGDFTRLNSTQLATSLSPGSNFFNSTNDVSGASVATRTPAHRNMLGFDIKNLGASGAIPNSATSATFTFSSNGDVYYPGVVGMAINLYAPDFTASAKSVVNVNGNIPSRPGDTLRYTVNSANTGQDPAVDVVSEDVLPPNTTYVPGSLALVNPLTLATTPLSDASGDDQGDIDGRTVRVRLGSGADATTGGRMNCSGPGCTGADTSRASYTFQVTLDDDSGGTTVTNLADLNYETETTGTEAVYTTNPASVDVVQQADVAITKDMTPDPAAVGGQVQATLTVNNAGPNTATGVTVTDPIPAGWEGVTATTNLGSCTVSGGTVSCSLGDMPDGATAQITLSGTTASGSTATALTNVATVSTTAFDPAPTNNVSGDTITLTRAADLAVTKVANPGPNRPGGPVSWTITVTNQGASDAQGVLVGDVLDTAGLATITGVQGAGCATPRVGTSVRCSITTLAAGASATITVQGLLASGLGAGVAVTNTATVTATTPDPDASNNTARATVTTTAPLADVRVTKTGPETVVAGRTITWTVTATNWGPADATGVTVTDAVPAGVSAVSATSSRGTCTVTENVVSCPAETLLSGGIGPDASPQPGAAVTITITGTVAPDAIGTLANTATAAATTTDPVPSNNAATANTAVTAEYDLSVTKSANRRTLPGEPSTVDYTVTVTNNGPSAARDIVVTDLPPLVFDLESATMPGAECDTSAAATPQPAPNENQGLITCTLPGPLAAGASVELVVDMVSPTAITAPDPTNQIAQVAAPADINPTNNSATWTLTGQPFADLALAKSAPDVVTAGGSATYTLAVSNLVNPEPGQVDLDAIAPVVVDALPAGVTFAGGATVTAPGNTNPQTVPCTQARQDLTCELSQNLDAGVTATITVPVAIAPDVAAGSQLVNSAFTQTGDPENNPDSNLANNSAQATSNVVAEADPAVSDMSITPVDAAQTGPGTQWVVAFTVSNGGPSTARQVTFRNTIGPDARLVDEGTLPEECGIVNAELVCTVGDLAPGEERDFSFTIDLAGYVVPGDYSGATQVSSTTPDSDAANNQASADFTVTAPVTDIRVTKTPVTSVTTPDEGAGGHPAFVAGGTFTYQFQVGVPGNPDVLADPLNNLADAQGVVLTDELPPGFTAQQISTSRGTCTITPSGDITLAGDALSCDLGTLPSGLGTEVPGPVVITVNGVLDPDANNLNGGDEWAEQVPNTAVVTTSTPLA